MSTLENRVASVPGIAARSLVSHPLHPLDPRRRTVAPLPSSGGRNGTPVSRYPDFRPRRLPFTGGRGGSGINGLFIDNREYGKRRDRRSDGHGGCLLWCSGTAIWNSCSSLRNCGYCLTAPSCTSALSLPPHLLSLCLSLSAAAAVSVGRPLAGRLAVALIPRRPRAPARTRIDICCLSELSLADASDGCRSGHWICC